MAHKIGAIPFKITDDGLSILFVTSLTRKRWIFPKGNLKAKESRKKACKREAFEEAGVKGKVLKKFPVTTVIGKSQNNKIDHQLVTYFPLHVHEEAVTWPEVNERKRLWVSLEKATTILDDDDLMKLVEWFKDISPWVIESAQAKTKER